MNQKKLYRSNTDRILTGVCGGVGEYWAIDSTIVRVLWTLITAFTGFIPGILVYIVTAFVMPEKPTIQAPSEPSPENTTQAPH